MKKRNGGYYYDGGNTGSGASNGNGAHGGEDALRDKVDFYGKMSQGELLDELFAEAAAARRRGELDDKKLMSFYDSVKGMLGAEEKKRLDVLMRALMSDK